MKLKKKIIEFMAMEIAMKEAKAVPDFGFQIFLSRNLKRLASELEDVKKGGEPTDAFKAVMQEFDKLRISLSKKDEKGRPVIISDADGQRYDPIDEAEFTKALEDFWKEESHASLEAEHKELIEEYRANITENEMEIDLVSFDIKSIPSSFFNDEKNRRLMLQVAELLEELFV
jgi:hypothetical protein